MSVTRWIDGQDMEHDQVLGLFRGAPGGRRSVSEVEGRNETGNELHRRFPPDDVAEVKGDPLDHIFPRSARPWPPAVSLPPAMIGSCRMVGAGGPSPGPGPPPPSSPTRCRRSGLRISRRVGPRMR